LFGNRLAIIKGLKMEKRESLMSQDENNFYFPKINYYFLSFLTTFQCSEMQVFNI